MKDSFSRYHPGVNFLYFAFIFGFSMVFMHPICLFISFLSSMIYLIELKNRQGIKFNMIVLLPVMVMTALINPAFNHEGATIITYLRTGNPLTLESIIYGKTGKEFDPNANMTRAEFATIVVKALGLSAEENNVFKDVKKSDWFYEFVGTANKYGIVKGISDKEFDPFGTITKEEAVTMVARASKMTGMEIPEDIITTRDILAQFEDYILVDDWARTSMAFAYKEGILESSDLKINPKEAVKRAEIAQMLFNMLEIAELL